jgi:hypothetical protein
MRTPNAVPPSVQLPALGAEAAGIIHDNLGIVLTYAFSKQALDDYRGWLRVNRWDASDRVLVDLPKQRATRAIIELAVMFRALDDVREITSNPYVTTHPFVVYHSTKEIYGKLYGHSGEPEPLPLREVSNKIIHANSIEWDFSNPEKPLIICQAAELQTSRYGWTRAEVFVKVFAAVCAALASPRT